MNKDLPFDVSRFSKFLPKKGDRDLILLKGHLLIEELLRTYLDQKVPNPKAIEEANLSFDQCLCLTKAFHADRRWDWLWSALKTLNKIRNDLAHKLEPKGFEDRLGHFLSIVEGETGREAEENLQKSGFERLSFVLIVLLHVITGVLTVELQSPIHQVQQE